MPDRQISGVMFFNPSSGVKTSAADLSALQQAAGDAGLEVVRVTRELNCSKLIRERMDQGVRLFVAAGGDGTINTVIQPLVNSDAILGVIPVGTYNHFAKDLGIPLGWREALDVVVAGATKPVDTARINDRIFVNNVSMGLYPELVARREEKGRDYPRWKARLYAALATLRKYPHVAVTLESEHHQEAVRTHVLMISNNSYDLSRLGIEAPREPLNLRALPSLRDSSRFRYHFISVVQGCFASLVGRSATTKFEAPSLFNPRIHGLVQCLPQQLDQFSSLLR